MVFALEEVRDGLEFYELLVEVVDHFEEPCVALVNLNVVDVCNPQGNEFSNNLPDLLGELHIPAPSCPRVCELQHQLIEIRKSIPIVDVIESGFLDEKLDEIHPIQ